MIGLNKIIKGEEKIPETYEEQLIQLQKEANKRLKSIDYTLDWFFWIMILGFVIFGLSFFV